MKYNYKDWVEKHNKCVKVVNRLCELDISKYDGDKCASAMAVMNSSMQDIDKYFKKNNRTSAELCFLIRNIDVIITSIRHLNHELLDVGLSNKAIKKCFNQPKIIYDFRTLRSQLLAHPVDTKYINDEGQTEIIYLEDILPANSMYGLKIGEHDYILKMCYPDTKLSHFEPLKIDTDIIPVINEIVDGISLLTEELQKSISEYEEKLRNEPLVIDNSDMESYIMTLDDELKKRYPSCVTDTKCSDGSVKHYSIVHGCLKYIEASFSNETQEKYDIFLDYIKSELKRIENDLQAMTYDSSEDSYFLLCYNPDFAKDEDYAKEKMAYLCKSNATSFTEEDIPDTTTSDALWGIQQFKKLIPYIEQYIPVDTTVSDRELYCEYIAAEYLSNKERT
ncbi:MAG: hypothetical protein GX957_11345 [Clostridiaceae bacterium]|nr:hypothetical protein [Clostridiaceae bacterium]